MYKKITYIVIPILVIALIGSGYFGYQEYLEKSLILIKAENQYQRAFHDLNYHIDKLDEELGKTLAVNSRKQISPCLANVWRLSYNAQSDLGQLPLVLIPFNKTEEYLANVADFSYRIAIRDLDAEPLSEKEYNTLKSLYQNSKEIQKELSSVQEKVIANQLRWMDVELALAQEDENIDNTIIDGFKTIDKKVEEFPETDWGPGITNLKRKSKDIDANLQGSLITKEEAKEIALDFLNMDKNTEIEVKSTEKGSNYEAFCVCTKGEKSVHLDITKKGGHVIWMIRNRELSESNLSTEEAIKKADDFLQNHDINSMIVTDVNEYENSTVINYAYYQDEVIIYPDSLSIKVALDDGEILGYQAQDYVFNHIKREIKAPEITKETAESYVNPNLKIFSTKLALIENTDGIEELTYEITGELDDTIYRIYISAENGQEEQVQRMS